MLSAPARFVFDHVIWVDRSDHLEPEASTSMDLTEADADFTIYNNGTIAELEAEVALAMQKLGVTS